MGQPSEIMQIDDRALRLGQAGDCRAYRLLVNLRRNRSGGGGGLIGIAIMSSGAAGLSRDFSVSVCKRVFNV